MQRILNKITGFCFVFVEEKYRSRFLNACLSNGIEVTADGKRGFRIARRDKPLLENITKGVIPCSFSRLYGLPSLLLPALSHAGALFAAAILLFLLLTFQSRVCDIRTEEDCEIPYDVLEGELSKAGLSVGTKWKDADLSVIENTVLSSSDTVGWIGIHRRGAVAYVSAREKIVPQTEEETLTYQNVVALCDGVVGEMNVKRGSAVVSVGDTVKKGDLLISGISSVNGVTVFTKAEGEVFILSSESFEVFVPEEQTESVLSKYRIASVSLSVFGRVFNIFKNSRNIAPECVIINKTTRAVFLGKVRLPLSLSVLTAYTEETKTEALTSNRLEEIARSRFSAELLSRLGGADLIRLRSETRFTEDGCTVIGEYTALREGGDSVVIAIDR